MALTQYSKHQINTYDLCADPASSDWVNQERHVKEMTIITLPSLITNMQCHNYYKSKYPWPMESHPYWAWAWNTEWKFQCWQIRSTIPSITPLGISITTLLFKVPFTTRRAGDDTKHISGPYILRATGIFQNVMTKGTQNYTKPW